MIWPLGLEDWSLNLLDTFLSWKKCNVPPLFASTLTISRLANTG
jgi:hypothetical protein